MDDVAERPETSGPSRLVGLARVRRRLALLLSVVVLLGPPLFMGWMIVISVWLIWKPAGTPAPTTAPEPWIWSRPD